MGLINFWGQKSKLDELQNDLSNLNHYVINVGGCIAEIDTCWVGNRDKQKIVNAIASHLHLVNKTSIDLNVFKQTATFVLVKMNELGSLVGLKAPSISQICLPGICDSFRLNPKIQINTTTLRLVADKIESERKHLDNSSFAINSTKNVIDNIVLNLFGLNNLLRAIDKHVAEQKLENQRIVSAIRQICALYESTEIRLKEKITAMAGLGTTVVVIPPSPPTPVPPPKKSPEGVKLKVPDDIHYKQTDYPKFMEDGHNVGCSATALATCLAYIRGDNYSPTDVSWGHYGTNKENVGVLSWYPGKSQHFNNEADKFKTMYDSLLNNKPSVIKVSGHYVSVIGIREGADVANLQTSDFIVIDSWDGKEKMLSDFKQDSSNQLITF